MPAIYPARLKQQVARILETFENPPALAQSLLSLFQIYADYTHRSGLHAPPPSLLETYRVPLPVLRQVLLALSPLARKEPSSALAACDALWAEPIYECRWLAAHLLGEIPPHPAEPVLERVRAWLTPLPDTSLMDVLVNAGLSRLRREAGADLSDLIITWLEKRDAESKKAALWMMKSQVKDPAYQNIPIVFRLLTPYLRKAPSELRPEILEVLSALIERSPQETAHLLIQNLVMTDDPDLAWLIRQVLHAFPDELQQSLRSALRNA